MRYFLVHTMRKTEERNEAGTHMEMLNKPRKSFSRTLFPWPKWMYTSGLAWRNGIRFARRYSSLIIQCQNIP